MRRMFNRLSPKKFLLTIVMAMAVIFSFVGYAGAATECSDQDLAKMHGQTFLGLPAWYKYLPGRYAGQVDPSNPNITTDPTTLKDVCQPYIEAQPGETLPRKHILLIVAAVLEMLIRIAAIAAFVFLIYGGFMYLTSSGNSEQVSKAGSTLLNAAIGLAISITATTLVNFFAERIAK